MEVPEVNVMPRDTKPCYPMRAVAGVSWLTGALAALLLVGTTASPGAPQEQAGQPAPESVAEASLSECMFCKSPQPGGRFFCTHCGRLLRVGDPQAAGRFWGDAFYVLAFPPLEDRPSLVAQVGGGGLVREIATFYSGDRYELDVKDKGAAISGKIRAWGTFKEVGYKATIQDTFEGEHLAVREVHGLVKANPERYLYRKLDYHYEGDRLERIDVGTWFYRGGSDWKKSPSEWLRHDRATIDFVYADELLSRIDVQSREGRRSLRGDLEYSSPRSISETVLTTNGIVIAIKHTAPKEGER